MGKRYSPTIEKFAEEFLLPHFSGPGFASSYSRNKVFPMQFLERHPDIKSARKICERGDLSMEFVRSLDLDSFLRIVLLKNEAIPQSFHEENFEALPRYLDLPYFSVRGVFTNARLSYNFCRRLVDEKGYHENLLLFNKNTPQQVVSRLLDTGKKRGPGAWAILNNMVLGPFASPEIAEFLMEERISAFEEEKVENPDEVPDAPNFHSYFEKFSKNPEIPISWFEEAFLTYYRQGFIRELYPGTFESSRIPFEFIRRILPELREEDLPSVLVNPNVTVPFVEELSTRIDPQEFYEYVCCNRGLPERFFEVHAKQIANAIKSNFFCLRNISRNSALSVEFFKRHPEFIDWPTIENEFTYQLLLEEEQTEKQLVENAQAALPEDLSLPSLMMKVIGQEIEKLEYRRWYR